MSREQILSRIQEIMISVLSLPLGRVTEIEIANLLTEKCTRGISALKNNNLHVARDALDEVEDLFLQLKRTLTV